MVARPWELVGAQLGGRDAIGVLRRRARVRKGATPLK
jgi:hypothetical protein